MMAGIKDLGKVKGDKGDKGDTYIPIFNSDDGFIKINLEKYSDNIENNQEILIEMPYYVPVKEDGKLKFVKHTSNFDGEVASFDIETELRGKMGAIHIELLNELPDEEDGRADTFYMILSEGGNLYAFDEDGNVGNKWVLLDSPIKFNDYLLISDAEDCFTKIKNSIDERVGQILEQQYVISELLGNITIDDG